MYIDNPSLSALGKRKKQQIFTAVSDKKLWFHHKCIVNVKVHEAPLF